VCLCGYEVHDVVDMCSDASPWFMASIDRLLVASARAVKISLYIILLLPPLTARAASRVDVFLAGHLPWQALVIDMGTIKTEETTSRYN